MIRQSLSTWSSHPTGPILWDVQGAVGAESGASALNQEASRGKLVLQNADSGPETACLWSSQRAGEVLGVAGAGRGEAGRVGGGEVWLSRAGWAGEGPLL